MPRIPREVMTMARNKDFLNRIFHNDKVVFVISLICALGIWLAVMIYASPETTRVIQGVKVNIDTAVPEQFGLEVFGEKDFTVDVTVKGKKYMISSSALSAEDIVVTAQTNNVDSAGTRTLQLKAESAANSSGYTISSLSKKTIDVYFDTLKTVQMVIEPKITADGFPIVEDGFTTGDLNLSETAVNVSGPSAQVNKIDKIVAEIVLDSSLKSNKSADAVLVPLDENGKSDFTNLTLDKNSVVLTIPVLRVKKLKTSVTFKNAPDSFVLSPLKYKISPDTDEFKISVDEYDETTSFSVGTVDFKSLSPSNHVFEFSAADIPVTDAGKTESYYVDVDVSGLSQEYFTVSSDKITVNAANKAQYKVLGLNKSVVVVGNEKSLESITEDLITVALNEAINKAKTESAAEMENLQSGLNIPGMPGLF